MKYAYRFSSLIGTVYKTGNQLFTPDGNVLLSPVGARVSCIDLVSHETTTLDFETRSDIARIALSPNGRLLIAVDVDGHALCVNLPRRVVVHRFNFKAPVADLAFSPDGRYLAVTHGRKLQVWRTPGLEREFAPFALHRTYTGHYDEVVAVDWSPNGMYIVTGSADMTARVYTLNPLPGYIPVTLSGHRDGLVSVQFAAEDVIYTVSKDGAVYVWAWKERADLSAKDAATLTALAEAQAAAAAAAEAEGAEDSDDEEEEDGDDDEGGEAADDGEGAATGAGSGNNSSSSSSAGAGAGTSSGSNRKTKRAEKRAAAAEASKRARIAEDNAAQLAAAAATMLGQDPTGARIFGQTYGRGKSVSGITDVLASRRPHPVPAPYGSPETLMEVGGVKVLSIVRGEWALQRKHYFKQTAASNAAANSADGSSSSSSSSASTAIVPAGTVLNRHTSRVMSCSLHKPSGLLVVGFANGVFGLYTMPDGTHLQALSISQHEIHSVAVNSSGQWLAFGSRTLGQLLVYDWKTESYVLKQQGHFYDLNCVAYSPNGQLMATGGDDGKVKVWNAASGFCFVTFTEHSAAVTGATFMGGRSAAGGHGLAVVTSSLDGTVRAFDLVRYRNFRTFSAPTPVQFLCVATDDAGEVVCAGGMDPFSIYVWSVQTGKLLDVLSGHEAPVSSLSYSASAGLLASGSWDKSVKLWDVFRSGTATETFSHGSDVTAVTFRPDGAALAAATLDGQITFWDVKKGGVAGTIEGRRDAAGGRKSEDVRTSASAAASKCFSALAYTADGACILAGGRSKYICLYAVGPKLLLKKWQLSHNRSLEGVLDKLNSKGIGDGGLVLASLDLEGSADPSDRAAPDLSLPGVKRGDAASRRRTGPELRTKALAFSPAGRSFAAACTEGLLVYSLDDSLVFDPFELGDDVTPAAARAALASRHYARGLLLALHLNEAGLIREAVEAPPAGTVPLIAGTIPLAFLSRLLEFFAARLAPGPAGGDVSSSGSGSGNASSSAAALGSSPHLEFYLTWALALLQSHGRALRERSTLFCGQLRSLQRSLLGHKESLGRLTERNGYALDFLCDGAGSCNSSSAVAHQKDGASSSSAVLVGESSKVQVLDDNDHVNDEDGEGEEDEDDAPLLPVMKTKPAAAASKSTGAAGKQGGQGAFEGVT